MALQDHNQPHAQCLRDPDTTNQTAGHQGLILVVFQRHLPIYTRLDNLGSTYSQTGNRYL
jgi:hypothetical protein